MTDDEPMAHEMTKEEWRAFVSHGTRTGKLSTVRADGRPHVAPVGFLLDGEELVFTTGEDTVKGCNLARDGQVALCVDDERPPYGFTVLQGRVTELSTDPVPLLTWATGSPPATWARPRPRSTAPATAHPGRWWSGSRSTRWSR
jgi:PPOX class probable F420-dependent enzyme